jgi:hypothetical protein
MRDSVAVIGSGLMGSGIAARSALVRNKTIIINRNLDHAKDGLVRAKNHIKELYVNGLKKGAWHHFLVMCSFFPGGVRGFPWFSLGHFERFLLSSSFHEPRVATRHSG